MHGSVPRPSLARGDDEDDDEDDDYYDPPGQGGAPAGYNHNNHHAPVPTTTGAAPGFSLVSASSSAPPRASSPEPSPPAPPQLVPLVNSKSPMQGTNMPASSTTPIHSASPAPAVSPRLLNPPQSSPSSTLSVPSTVYPQLGAAAHVPQPSPMATVSPRLAAISEDAPRALMQARYQDPRADEEAYDRPSQTASDMEQPSRTSSQDDLRTVKVPRQVAMGAESQVGIGINFRPNAQGHMVVTSLLEGGPAKQSHQGQHTTCTSLVHIHKHTCKESHMHTSTMGSK
jgi:hypothetical protein